MPKEEIKNKIQRLVEKYEIVRNSGQLRSYSEEQTKKDLILPLFEALGWDTTERNEVSAEESIKSAGRVDYGFYLDGRIKFYLETKKLSADLNQEDFAHQAIKYSWNKGATWAVLTDFESIKIFNAQDIEKSLGDKLFFEIPYNKYIEDFNRLWLLSKESFADNLLDKKAVEWGKKLQKVSVTSLLYRDLQKCREILTDSLSKCNDNLDENLLDEGVQKLLDRLIFLRVAEDRGVEESTLIPMIRQWDAGGRKGNLYQSMISKFRELDKIYNSNLFTPHPFEQWEEYSDATEKVVNILYGKKGYYEYDFKAMPADVLGNIYENFLNYRLQKSKKLTTAVQNAKKRKEQGIYYTPPFIVDYIVKNALEPILDKCHSISELKKIKVLDPACGSGSFLMKTLEIITEKYKDLGMPDNALTKIQILSENIYGIDLDEKAIEIARLNLLINALDAQMRFPLLNNIKNGNSLISSTDEELEKAFGKNFRDKKPFNWQEEFPEVFKQGGFDCIIGNPPYIKEYTNKEAFDGLKSNPYYQGKMDIWTMFSCIAIGLLKENGILSFIAPNNWISNAGASIFRNKILTDGELKTFIDFGDYKIFEQAGIQTMIFIFEKKNPNKKYTIDYLKIDDKNISENQLILNIYSKKIKIDIEPEKLINKNLTFSNHKSGSIYDKIQNKRNFELTEKEVAQGIVADPDKAFIFENYEKYSELERKIFKKYYTSVGKYFSGKQRGMIAYLDKNGNYDIEKLPSIKDQLLQHKTELNNRREVKNKKLNWFNLHWPRDEEFFINGPKIIGGIRVKYPSFYYTEKPYYGSRALNFVKTDKINLKYLTGILNSRLSYFWLKNKGKQLGDLLQIDKRPLLEIPIFIGEKEQQKSIIALVDEMLKLNKELRKIPENSNKWHAIKSEIEKTDKKIDQEIYNLYGLTEKEIKTIEENTK